MCKKLYEKIRIMKKKVSAKKSAPKKQSEKEFERENYLHNRNNMLEDFHSALKEVQLDTPIVGGEIAGMNSQQFSARSIFRNIKEQEEYIITAAQYKLSYVDVEEEKVILKGMVSAAKKVFGKSYKEWYKK